MASHFKMNDCTPQSPRQAWFQGLFAEWAYTATRSFAPEPDGEYNAAMDWRARVATDPAVMHGQTCIKGTRIPVSVVLDNLAEGHSAEDIVKSYPSLTTDDVRAAIAYAAEMARERVLPLQHAG